jgi:hypothetical protein
MLQYYRKEITNVDHLKPKVTKLTYTRKIWLNIDGTTIHFALAIPLNKFFNELKTLNDEKRHVKKDIWSTSISSDKWNFFSRY